MSVSVSNSMCEPKRNVWDSSICQSYAEGIAADFHSQMFWRLPSLALVVWSREPSVSLRSFAPQEDLHS